MTKNLKKVEFNRATANGWIPCTGLSCGELAVAKYDKPSIRKIFHVRTGMALPRTDMGSQKATIELMYELAVLPQWEKLRQKDKIPGSWVCPDFEKLQKQASKIILDFEKKAGMS